MKKISFILAMLASVWAFNACTSDSLDDDFGKSEIECAKLGIKAKLAGAVTPDETPASIVTSIDYHWEAPFNVVEKLPESKTPEAVYSNYYYYSTGEPFTVVMLYSNGLYRHVCGLYWYDNDNVLHEQDMWDERTISTTDWYNPNGGKNEAMKISRLTDKAGAYEINLPKNTRFGFYQKSFYPSANNYKSMVYGTTETTCTKCKGTGKYGYLKCTTCSGTGKVSTANEEEAFKFYSEVSLNWNGKCQTVTFNIDESDWTVVGLEDISRSGSNTSGFSSDHDFNDCVFAVNPKLHIVPLPVEEDPVITPPAPEVTPEPEPEPEPIIYPNQGSVETNLSITEKDALEHIRLSIHVRDTTDVTITLPYVDQALADDFAIVAKHDIEAVYHDKMMFGDHEVELIYGMTEEGYLTVTTKGIDAQVLEYCRNTYADGITFECNLDFPAGATISGKPTISFTKTPYVYITSCVNNSADATDIEVEWTDGGSLIYENPEFGDPEGLTYTHKYYSTHTLEQLKQFKWFVYDDFE